VAPLSNLAAGSYQGATLDVVEVVGSVVVGMSTSVSSVGVSVAGAPVGSGSVVRSPVGVSTGGVTTGAVATGAAVTDGADGVSTGSGAGVPPRSGTTRDVGGAAEVSDVVAGGVVAAAGDGVALGEEDPRGGVVDPAGPTASTFAAETVPRVVASSVAPRTAAATSKPSRTAVRPR